jgi:energy-coupling factor transporter ATPase
MSFIHVQDLSYHYFRGTPLEVEALSGITLEIARGEVVGIIGATGSGKSTLLQHLCGLLRPQSGRVRVAGLELSDPSTDLRAVRRRVGMVFQSPEDQLFERYVGDDVAFGPKNLGLPRDQVRERVRRAMEAVGLGFDAFKDRLTVTLSGGEQRKAALAGILALEPDALLLDEPTAGLDPVSREELLALLRRWHVERGATLVVSSHNMDDIAYLAGRVYVLDLGRVALSGSTREVFSGNGRLQRLGLEPPGATAVAQALAAVGLPIDLSVLTLDEAADAIERIWDPRKPADERV